MKHKWYFLLMVTLIVLSVGASFYVFAGVEGGGGDEDEYARMPELKGVAYVQGHGGHIAVIDLENGDVGRLSHGKPCDALTLSEDGKTAYTFSLDGWSTEIDVESGKKTEWKELGKKHCGSAITPDGKQIWVSDMADGHIYVYDRKTKKKVDAIPVSKSICMIAFSKDGKKAYVADMPGGFVSVIDVKKKKVVGKIAKVGTFIHRGRLTPDGKQIWVSDGAELKEGMLHGAGYTDEEPGMPGGVTIIDTKTNKVLHKMIIGGNPHDVTFTPDGAYALVATRQYPYREEVSIVVINTETYDIVNAYPTCNVCHKKIGLQVSAKNDQGRPFNCAIDVDWNRKGLPKGVEKF